MIELIIGGRAQGKRKIACEEYPDHVLLDGGQIELPSKGYDPEEYDMDYSHVIIMDHTHLLIRRMLTQSHADEQQDKLQEKILEQLISLTSAGTNTREERTVVFVSDEIACGIVPMDPFERTWREVCGRVLTTLASRADRVERVTCGIVQILK